MAFESTFDVVYKNLSDIYIFERRLDDRLRSKSNIFITSTTITFQMPESYPKMPFFWWIFILGKQLFVNESCLKGLLRALIKAGWIREIREIVEILKSDKLLGRLQLFWADAGLLGINFGIVGFVLIAVWRKARYFPSFLLMNEQDVQGVEFVGLLLNAQGDKLLSH